MSSLYRYPGVKPFEATDAALFFGRGHDRADLLDLVGREQLTVLFGKSGYGKSSLLKAGLIPDLLANPNTLVNPKNGEDFIVPNFPIYIRLNLYGKGNKSVMPLDTMLQRLREAAGADDTDKGLQAVFKQKQLNSTLWAAFKCSKIASQQCVYLIFDQFEEFFSYPPKAQAEFREQISELLYTRIPQAVRDEMDSLDSEQKHRIHQAFNVHVLFSIRSDRMHLMNSMRIELPAILHKRYELSALSESQAREAIVKPAALTDKNFLLQKPFEYEPAALQKILLELSKPPEDLVEMEYQSHIEAFQLQMVCQTIEQKLIALARKSKNGQPMLVREADLPDFKQIYEQYYGDKLTDLPGELSQQTAHVLLEEVMVIGDDMSNIRRISMDKDLLKDAILQNHHLALTQELLDALEDRFLIRRETIGGHIHYELSHDVLLPPLLKSREEARAREAVERARSAAEKRAHEAEARAHKERVAREYAEKRRRRARWLALASVTGFVLAAIVGGIAVNKEQIARDALSKLKIEEAKRLEVEKEKRKIEFYQTIEGIEIILKSPDGCPDEWQMTQLYTLPQEYEYDDILQKRVNEVKEKIRTNHCL